jgi:hypothetical protein
MGVTWFDFPRSRSDEQPGETHRLHLVPVALVPLRTNPLPDLDESTVSTRALYGNRDHRPPFPGLFPRPIPVSNLALTELDPGNGEPQQQITRPSPTTFTRSGSRCESRPMSSHFSSMPARTPASRHCPPNGTSQARTVEAHSNNLRPRDRRRARADVPCGAARLRASTRQDVWHGRGRRGHFDRIRAARF